MSSPSRFAFSLLGKARGVVLKVASKKVDSAPLRKSLTGTLEVLAQLDIETKNNSPQNNSGTADCVGRNHLDFPERKPCISSLYA